MKEKKALIALVAFGLVCFAYLGINGIISKNRGDIHPPASSSDLKGKNYEDVDKMMTDQGFTNVTLEPVEDLVLGFLKEDGEVEEVSINGYTTYSTDSWFSPDTAVIIKYHTFKQQAEAQVEDETHPEDVKEEPVKAEQATVVDPEKQKETEPEKPEQEMDAEIAEESEKTESEEPAQEAETEEKTEERPSNNEAQYYQSKKEGTYYSTNDSERAKLGNSGKFAYIKNGPNYDTYYVIDFNEGLVYRFLYGQGDKSGELYTIDSGDLNSGLYITYYTSDSDSAFTDILHFHYKNSPNTLIEVHNYEETKFRATSIDEALKLKNEYEFPDY